MDSQSSDLGKVQEEISSRTRYNQKRKMKKREKKLAKKLQDQATEEKMSGEGLSPMDLTNVGEFAEPVAKKPRIDVTESPEELEKSEESKGPSEAEIRAAKAFHNKKRNMKRKAKKLAKKLQDQATEKQMSGEGPSIQSPEELTNFGELEEPVAKKPRIDVPENPEKSDKTKDSQKSTEFEIIELHALVRKVQEVPEKNELRMVLEELPENPLILATCAKPLQAEDEIVYADRIHISAKILEKDPSGEIAEVVIVEVIENKGFVGDCIDEYPISKKPFCLKPKFIHETADPAIQRAVIQVTILDKKATIYQGCSKCDWHVMPFEDHCRKCQNTENIHEDRMYCVLRFSDFSGQMIVNADTANSIKFMAVLGYHTREDWDRFAGFHESHDFESIMVEVVKQEEDWVLSDVAEVDWDDFGEYLKEREQAELPN